MLSTVVTLINRLFDWAEIASGGIVNRYGFYTIGDEGGRFFFWGEVIVALLFVALIIYWRRWRVAAGWSRHWMKLYVELAEQAREARKRAASPVPQAGAALEYAPVSAKQPARARGRKRAAAPEPFPKPGAIIKAIEEGQDLLMDYVRYDGTRSRRRVRPLRMYYRGGHVYMDAYCHLREEERQFRVDRILGMRLAA